jgi:catechol 2,3-dioxygenase
MSSALAFRCHFPPDFRQVFENICLKSDEKWRENPLRLAHPGFQRCPSALIHQQPAQRATPCINFMEKNHPAPEWGPTPGIGHIHLKVADLERSIAFYRDVLGFELTQRFGRQAAFLSFGGYHHHLGLNTWQSVNGRSPTPGSTGLYHFAIVYPTRAALAQAAARLIKSGVALDGAADHGVSPAVYFRDPDNNGVELYWDKPREEWPRTDDGELSMSTDYLDLESLLAEAEAVEPEPV